MNKFFYELETYYGQFYAGGPVLFLPDGKKIVFSSGNSISIINLNVGKLQPLNFQVRSTILTFSVDKKGKFIAAIDNTNLLVIIDINKKIIKSKMLLKGKVFCLKWSPFGKYIVLAVTKYAQVWKPSLDEVNTQVSFQLSRTYSGHYSDIWDIDWSSNGNYFITGGSDGIIKIFSFRKRNKFSEVNLNIFKEKIIFVKFGPDLNHFLVLCKNNILYKWEFSKKKIFSKNNNFFCDFFVKLISRCRFLTKNSVITTVSINLFSENFFLGFSDGYIKIFKVLDIFLKKENRSFKKKLNSLKNLRKKMIFRPFLSQISFLSKCTISDLIVIGNYKKGKILVYDFKKKKVILSCENLIYKSSSISISSNEKLICTGNLRGMVNIWSIKTGFCIIKFHNHNDEVNRVCFFENNSRMVLSSSSDGTLKLYDLEKCSIIRTLNTFYSIKKFESLAINKTGSFVASACRKTFSICLWSLKSGKLIEIFKGHKSKICDIFFIQKKLKIISGSCDKTFRIWHFEDRDISKYRSLCEIFQTQDKILKISLHPNLNEIAVLIQFDYIFFFDTEKSIFLSRIKKNFRKIFNKKILFKKNNVKISLIYSFNGRKILIGNFFDQIFSFDRFFSFPISSYSIFFIPYFDEKNKQTQFRKNYFPKLLNENKEKIIDLVSLAKTDKWIALSCFGFFLFKNSSIAKFGLIFSKKKIWPFENFLWGGTFFWYFLKKKEIFFLDNFWVEKKLLKFFKKRTNYNESLEYNQSILKTFFNSMSPSLKENFFFFFRLFYSLNQENSNRFQILYIFRKLNKKKKIFLKKIKKIYYNLIFKQKFKMF